MSLDIEIGGVQRLAAAVEVQMDPVGSARRAIGGRPQLAAGFAAAAWASAPAATSMPARVSATPVLIMGLPLHCRFAAGRP